MAADHKARSAVFKTLEEVTLVEIKEAIERETDAESIVRAEMARVSGRIQREIRRGKIIEIAVDLASLFITCNPPKGYHTNVLLMGLRA